MHNISPLEKSNIELNNTMIEYDKVKLKFYENTLKQITKIIHSTPNDTELGISIRKILGEISFE